MSYLTGIALPKNESLTVEFKSDRAGLSDRDNLSAVVCLANTDGGELYIGLEDDGSVSSARTDRDAIRLAAMIANRTRPSQSVRVTLLKEEGQIIVRIEVPRSFQIVATSDGTVLRRRLLADGAPECVPFFPYEFDQRGGDLGRVDYSERPLLGAAVEEFDPLERQRLRQMVDAYRGDRVLLDLSDEELDGALGLSAIVDGRRVPTVTGMLLLGREAALREHLPAHEVAFQVLQDTEVRVNDFYRTPLLRTYETVLQYFDARVEEQELLIDGFRVPVPSYDRSAFREALANAMIHRDYTRLGAIHVQWLTEGIDVSNPGGFVDGVRLENLLVVPPHPRNPMLADAFKRVGLVERTGRGVDIIFRGALRTGRPPPSYSRSGSSSVVVRLPGGKADLGFVRLMVEEQRRTGVPPSVESLLVLRALEQDGSIDVATAARLIQRDDVVTRAVLETLESDGLIAAWVSGKRRLYRLSPEVARQLGTAQPTPERARIGAEPQEQAILDVAARLGRLTRREVMPLCGVSSNQAKRLLDRLVEEGRLVRRGVQRGTYYEPAP